MNRIANKNQKGFSHLEMLIVAIVIVVIGLVGYYVWHTQHNKKTSIDSYTSCANANGVIQQSYPEKCTKDGKSFTNPSQKAPSAPKSSSSSSSTSQSQSYLTISEWNIKMSLGDSSDKFYYKVSNYQTEGSNSDLTVYSEKADAIVGPLGISCKGEYIAYLLRLPSDDTAWQPSTSVDDGNVSPLYGERTVVGDYRYAIATKKQYGPNCFNKGSDSDYEADESTSQQFSNIVSSFAQDFKTIQAE